MSNDLISRSELIEKLRLLINRSFLGETTFTSQISIGEVATVISELPVAYDVDGVVKKLKENEEDILEAINENCEFPIISTKHLKEIFEEYTKEIIKLVKEGGVDG